MSKIPTLDPDSDQRLSQAHRVSYSDVDYIESRLHKCVPLRPGCVVSENSYAVRPVAKVPCVVGDVWLKRSLQGHHYMYLKPSVF